MGIEIDGSGLADECIEAMSSGLETMGVGGTSVVVTDNFVSQVRRRTGEAGYSAGRGSGVVAARTVVDGSGEIVVVNAPAIADRSVDAVERLLAHEGGHVLLHRRGEDIGGRNNLVETASQWHMLALGALAIEEFRIEKALAGLGYPASDTGVVDHLDQALYWLNCELVDAVYDPRSADPRHMMESAIRSQDWLTKNLAYMAAYHSGVGNPRLSALSAFGRTNWADYLSADWPARAALYASIPDVLQTIDQEKLDGLLLDGMRLETNLLRALGYYFTESSRGTAFYRVRDEARWDRRVQRAIAETQQRQTA